MSEASFAALVRLAQTQLAAGQCSVEGYWREAHAAEQPPTFMDLAGPRFVYGSGSSQAFAELLRDLKNWRL
jgi:hypothetical protein